MNICCEGRKMYALVFACVVYDMLLNLQLMILCNFCKLPVGASAPTMTGKLIISSSIKPLRLD
jgi:hypothetical protein